MYHFGEDYVGETRNTTAWKEPFEKCNKIIGWQPFDYSEVASFWESVRVYLNDRQKELREKIINSSNIADPVK